MSKTLSYAIGIDLGIRTGAVVLITMDGPTKVLSHSSLAKWSKRHDGARIRYTPEQLAKFTQEVIISSCSSTLARAREIPIGIDWTPEDVYWGGNKKGSVIKGFVMGYLYCALLAMGGRPLTIPPKFIRKFVGSDPKTEKGEIHGIYEKFMGVENSVWSKYNEHEKDSLILAFLGDRVNRNPDLVRLNHDQESKRVRLIKRTRRTRATRVRRRK